MKTVFAVAFAVLSFGTLALPAKAAPIIVPQDIVFLVDSSGSIGEQAFEDQRAFLSSVYNNEIVGNGPSRTGIIQFATDAITLHDFTDDQSPSAINAVIDGMVYNRGWTNTVEALEQAITMFDLYTNDLNPKLMVLLTDGNPSLPNAGDTNVCQFVAPIFSRDIGTAIVGIGNGWDPNRVDCLVQDPSDIFAVNSFGDLSVLTQDQTFVSLFGQGYIIPDPQASGVPAPGALAFLGLGLMGIAGLKRREA